MTSPATTTLPRVDPNDPIGPLKQITLALLRTKPGRWFGINIASRADPYLLKYTKGKVALGVRLPSALLTTVGATSSEPRTSTVLYFNDGESVILVASNFGQAKHPAWYFNLRRNPQVTLLAGSVSQEFAAQQITAEDEISRVWALAFKVYPLFRNYIEYAAAHDRVIALIRLTPSGKGSAE
ncbi:MAG: nitroreductase family deazaflavin-dependent oxidoreductase [Segniliparus sp.]|uniref:nitroreductase family deazaflavin-dependent oxidoreductase n=1 Tax=Segniliparus sp. TaxID=2804064 RepID=UPI003F40645D